MSEGQIAKFVEDDEVHAGQVVGEPALAAGAGLGLEPVDEIDHVVEPAAGAGSDAASGNGDGKMRLASAGPANQHGIGAAEVLALIKRLKERGYGVIVISHNLADVFEVADRIVVLRLGRNAGVFDGHSDSSEDVVAAITGASDSAALERERARIGRSHGEEGVQQ